MKRMPEDVTCALLRGGNTLGSRQIKEAIKNNTIDIVSLETCRPKSCDISCVTTPASSMSYTFVKI